LKEEKQERNDSKKKTPQCAIQTPARSSQRQRNQQQQREHEQQVLKHNKIKQGATRQSKETDDAQRTTEGGGDGITCLIMRTTAVRAFKSQNES
jgi:hypothetical protein